MQVGTIERPEFLRLPGESRDGLVATRREPCDLARRAEGAVATEGEVAGFTCELQPADGDLCAYRAEAHQVVAGADGTGVEADQV